MSKKEVRVGSEGRPVLVTFPVYRKHELGAFTIFTRIDENLRASSITVAKGGNIYGVEFEETYVFDESPEGYHLGFGVHGSSAEEFQGVVGQLKAALNEL